MPLAVEHRTSVGMLNCAVLRCSGTTTFGSHWSASLPNVPMTRLDGDAWKDHKERLCFIKRKNQEKSELVYKYLKRQTTTKQDLSEPLLLPVQHGRATQYSSEPDNSQGIRL
jgi:hypothetical protein